MIMALGMTVVILSNRSLRGRPRCLGGVVAAMLAGQGASWHRRRHCSATLLGVVNGLLVSRARLQPFVVTLFTASAARGWR